MLATDLLYSGLSCAYSELLFSQWSKAGANLGNLRLSIKNIIFHAGIAGV